MGLGEGNCGSDTLRAESSVRYLREGLSLSSLLSYSLLHNPFSIPLSFFPPASSSSLSNFSHPWVSSFSPAPPGSLPCPEQSEVPASWPPVSPRVCKYGAPQGRWPLSVATFQVSRSSLLDAELLEGRPELLLLYLASYPCPQTLNVSLLTQD